MDVAELNETSTSEEIQAFVDEIAADRTGEAQAPEPKSDAAIVADHANNNETPVASGDEIETATAPKKGKGETADDRSWLDDDLKAEVSAYGIGDEELADFTSREEVERALRFFDKSALEAGRKAMAEGDQKETGRDEKGRFVAKAAETETEKPKTGYEPKLTKDVYDDAIVDEFTRMRDHYEERLQALEAKLGEADARAEEQHFDGLVDSLGHADLFGKTGKEDAKQLQRRTDLHVAVKAQMLGLAQLGRPTEMSESLINRVARMVFAEELGKRELKERTKRIAKQSNGRQGGGVTRPTEPNESPRDWADRLFKELQGA